MSAQGSVRFRWGIIKGPYHANFTQVETQKFDPHWFYCLQCGCNNLFCQECILSATETVSCLITEVKAYMELIIVVSSVYRMKPNSNDIFHIYIMKGTGPKIEPCGTLIESGRQFDLVSSIPMCCNLLVR